MRDTVDGINEKAWTKAMQQTEDTHNRETEAIELERWKTQPERQLAYYRFIQDEIDRAGKQRLTTYHPSLIGASVSTWMGTRIGTITSARVYPHNIGSRMVAITVTGSNGAHYYGRASWDWGTCINLRKVKA